MKTIKSLLLFAFIGLSFVACSDDDDAPVPVNEEETITTLRITLVPEGGGTNITIETQDLDGDGPNDPVRDISGNLSANTTYTGSIVFLNETETPAEDITEEVEEEDDEHQIFYIPSGSITSVTYDDQDGNGNPLGLAFTLETGAAGNATLEVTLVHEPKKPNDGTLSDAGGEVDFTDNYALTIE
ncbi:type 1 periplasmic binding fold superfamily protein [Allomuricauda sp.]|uniref:type 1 periplasmic binding fold superfamily protein n=1 Tax=Flagellimonas sp. TaxID=2058762 RepID=UPI001B21A36C|nr:type 1 periplasmic binding fold superfamily protein [Allomuricauda sp.]MBO6829531.1 type 1 periplasmic binding fold superfamily protein [Allomuricauda sp.]